MSFLHILALGATIVIGASLPAQAAPVTYKFSGMLTDAYSEASGGWPFAAGQSFSGTFVYDAEAIQSHVDYISDPDWSLDFYFSPITSFSFQIDGAAGLYRYSPPTGLASSAAVGDSTSPAGWEGVNLRLANYPFNRGGQPAPGLEVPDSAYIGDLYPHATFLDLTSYGRPDLLDGTSPDIDLAELFDRLGTSGIGHDSRFMVRFTDPANPSWAIGTEYIAAVVHGRIDTLEVLDVPEPAAAGVLALGLVALTRRRRQVATAMRVG